MPTPIPEILNRFLEDNKRNPIPDPDFAADSNEDVKPRIMTASKECGSKTTWDTVDWKNFFVGNNKAENEEISLGNADVIVELFLHQYQQQKFHPQCAPRRFGFFMHVQAIFRAQEIPTQRLDIILLKIILRYLAEGVTNEVKTDLDRKFQSNSAVWEPHRERNRQRHSRSYDTFRRILFGVSRFPGSPNLLHLPAGSDEEPLSSADSSAGSTPEKPNTGNGGSENTGIEMSNVVDRP